MDLANLVSIRHALPVAVFDLAAVTGVITVRFATGAERFTDLATGEESPPPPGEVVFVDEAGLVSARRWCWRQSLESAAGAATTTALMTVEGQHDDAGADVAAALTMLERLVARHCPEAAIVTARLGPGRPAFAVPG